MIPYGRQWIDEEDILGVSEVLRSDWLTTGPNVEQFERAFARQVGAEHAVAVSSGTAALHAAVFAAGIGPGDEVIVPAMTFAATANAVVYQGGRPIFADVDPNTLLIDLKSVEAKLSAKTRAIIAVDYAGQPADANGLQRLAGKHNLRLLADACHSLGGSDGERPVGTLADLSCFSFHPVKHITTGEGGMISTGDEELARRMRLFRNHGITTDHRERERKGSFAYEMVDLGFNYRLTDLQSRLGLNQLKKLPGWIARRREIASFYDEAFRSMPGVRPLAVRPGAKHAYHLYVIRLELERLRNDRLQVFQALRAEGIGVNVHYLPVHLHPYYQRRFETGRGMCPVAERVYDEILSLPMFPRMTNEDVQAVVRAVARVIEPLLR